MLREFMPMAATLRGFACALTLLSSTLVLPGCMSAVMPTKGDIATVKAGKSPAEAEADYVNQSKAADGSTQDQQVVAVNADAQQAGYPAANAMMPQTAAGQQESLIMQTTGLKATSNSIFASQVSSQATVPVQPAADAAGQPLPIDQQQTARPFGNSLFHNSQSQTAPAALPLEGASNAQAVPGGDQVASAQSTSVLKAMPASVPVPSSAVAALAGERAPTAAPAQAAIAANMTSGSPDGPSDQADGRSRDLTIAALFVAKRKGKTQKRDSRSAQPNPAESGVQEVAALGYVNLPRVRKTSMFATVEDSQPEHDDESAAIELASLPGLARLAPNGLWLQTDSVETGCFKPELMQVLKTVEARYGRKVVVTSGMRGEEHNRQVGGVKHSLHTTCAAADIQVAGVSKWDLAAYLRTIPGRGGVGTYCHTESVHIDIGELRDWNWRCRRRKA